MKMILVGTFFAAAILFLMTFVTTVSAQSFERQDLRGIIKDILESDEWYPGYWILEIIVFILICFLKGIMPP